MLYSRFFASRLFFLLFIGLQVHAVHLHNMTSEELKLLKVIHTYYGSNIISKTKLAPNQEIGMVDDGPFHFYEDTGAKDEWSYIGVIGPNGQYEIYKNAQGTLKIKEKIVKSE